MYDYRIMRATQAIIDLNSFKTNLKNIHNLLNPKTQICVPVKANAYGHGDIEIAKAAIEADCNVTHLAVATVSEGIKLREAGISCHIIMFSLPSPDEVYDVIDNNLEPFIFDTQMIDIFDLAASKLKKHVFVHLAIDTGMSRIGCSPNDAKDIASYIYKSVNVKIAGVCTHFAVSDSLKPEDKDFTLSQLNIFTSAINDIKNLGINPGIIHCSNSGAILIYPQTHFDMVRPGIITYGYMPSDDTKLFCSKTYGLKFSLTPVMTVKTQVCAIKTIHYGESVSYGRTWIADSETDIAILPIGYADGILRRFATTSIPFFVTIKNKKYPVIGRVCMDQCMINLGKNHNIQRWDSVTVFGKESESFQTAETIAKINDTISYEVLCGIDNRVVRIYI